jgi:hypothetical protein
VKCVLGDFGKVFERGRGMASMRASLYCMSLILGMPNVGDNQRFGSQYPWWCTSSELLRSVDRELAKTVSYLAT